MEAIRAFVVLLVAVAVIDAGRIAPSVYKQSKVTSGRSANGKRYIPTEWINISMKSDSVVTSATGKSLILECEAVGSPPPTIKWHHGTNIVTEAELIEQNEVINTAIGKVKSRLVIDCAMPHHAGVYSCSGSAGVKSKNSSPITVLIEESTTTVECPRNAPQIPHIVVWGPTLLETVDKDITLPCTAIGNPQPEVYWLNNRNEVIDTEVISPRYKVLSNGELIISQITWDDMGTYTCVAQNSVGEDKIESFIYPVKKDESS